MNIQPPILFPIRNVERRMFGIMGREPIMFHRKDTIPVKVGNLTIGGSNEVIMQSMCTTKTADVKSTVAEIIRLEEAGCQLVRVTVNNQEAADAIKHIKRQIHIPLVADIHFDHRLALAAIENG